MHRQSFNSFRDSVLLLSTDTTHELTNASGSDEPKIANGYCFAVVGNYVGGESTIIFRHIAHRRCTLSSMLFTSIVVQIDERLRAVVAEQRQILLRLLLSSRN